MTDLLKFNAPILADDENAIEKLRAKIAKAEQRQESMKAGNKIIRAKKLSDEEKRQKLGELGFGDSLIDECLTPDYMGRYGFPAYALTNNNANIRRMKGRVEELEREQAQRGLAEDKELVPGVTVSENTDINRIQLFFDGKPDYEVRKMVKANGFIWSGREGAWQRQLNDNGRAAARRVGVKLQEMMQAE